MTFDVVVPTIGRASLATLLRALASAPGPNPSSMVLVDDRRDRTQPLPIPDLDEAFAARIRVECGRSAGPAAARNIGWRSCTSTWIAFLDDDVVPSPSWLTDLAIDLRAAGDDVAGSQGRVRVPIPAERRPTDWERNVAGLATATWITADCAYRRSELLATGGFDERFPRAYREDADLALRVVVRGRRITLGRRTVDHPVRPAPWSISIRVQAGNADDVLMDALHGPSWRARAGAPRGAFGHHAFVTATAVAAAAAATAGRPRLAAIAGTVSLAAIGVFAAARIAPGPRSAGEIARMIVTSAVIPFAAVFHRMRGLRDRKRLLADTKRAPRPLPAAVLFDRDGTLAVDVADNGDPARVVPMPGARAALERLRKAHIPIAVVSNQGGIAAGRITREDVDAVNAQLEVLLGPLGPILFCPHGVDDACACRKPAPGMIADAAAALGVRARDCVVIGDIGSDVEAAAASGARAILVPTPLTRPEEVAGAPEVAGSLAEALDRILGSGG